MESENNNRGGDVANALENNKKDGDKKRGINKGLKIAIIVGIIAILWVAIIGVVIFWLFGSYMRGSMQGDAKPVIYVYSAEDNQEVHVKLTTDSEITCEYPVRDNGEWVVNANKDGTLINKDGLEYNYLYWEGESNNKYDLSKGYCVKGSESREFLEDKLKEIGLTRREANEFIVYWLPKLESSNYNIIAFQTDVDTNNYKLEVSPDTDNILRVFMAFKSVDNYIDIEEQDLDKIKGNFKREGLHIVEWGGSEIE